MEAQSARRASGEKHNARNATLDAQHAAHRLSACSAASARRCQKLAGSEVFPSESVGGGTLVKLLNDVAFRLHPDPPTPLKVVEHGAIAPDARIRVEPIVPAPPSRRIAY
jgi:predicted short-subunit dehydrogenase-like oxidoreductase (DUF2520 family)